jgi:hypothetical protein
MNGLAEIYFAERGLELQYAEAHHAQIDREPYVNFEKNLGFPPDLRIEEVIWFWAHSFNGKPPSPIARPLPTFDPTRKFLCPKGGDGRPFLGDLARADHKKAAVPLIITEGPVKCLVLEQAGYASVGLNGVFCAHAKDKETDKLILREELREFEWRGRKVYIAFDADATTNPEVRHAQIRLFFLLSESGAEVFQLTSWSLEEGKGIDEFLVTRKNDPEGPQEPAEVLRMLMADAAPFIDTFRKDKVDLDAVESELTAVRLSGLYREQLVKKLAPALGVPVAQLRGIGRERSDASHIVTFDSPEPWPEEVDGAELFDSLLNRMKRHVICNQHGETVTVLWIPLTYLVDYIDTLGLLAVTSPQKRCGKTRLLGLLSRLTYRPLTASNISSATVYRVIEQCHPTLLIDEADSFLPSNEQLRGILNSGHTRDTAFVLRVNPETLLAERFSTWEAKAIALIGKLEGQLATIADRSFPVGMERRRKKDRRVLPLRDTPPKEFLDLCRKLKRWIDDHADEIITTKVALPESLNDRAADHWLPLFQIAQVVGGDWPKKLLRAAAYLCGDDSEEESDVIKLLVALRTLFREHQVDTETAIPSTTICLELNKDQEAPWTDWRNGQGLSVEKLAKMLRPFDVRSIQLQKGGDRARGYRLKDLQPAFDRYLGPEKPAGEAPS